MTIKQSDQRRISVRMSPKLYSQIELVARLEGRTMQEIGLDGFTSFARQVMSDPNFKSRVNAYLTETLDDEEVSD